MSRLAKKPIILPEGVTAKVEARSISFKGSKGEASVQILPMIQVALEPEGFRVTTARNEKQARANLGTMCALLANAIEGVTNGFEKILEIEGVGYKANMEGSTLVLALGFSHPVRFPVPAGITMVTEKNTIKISGLNKELVGKTAAQIRNLKKPEPYKGKGIRYKGEVIRRKTGKKASTGAA